MHGDYSPLLLKLLQQTCKTLPHFQMLLKEQIKMLTYGKTSEPCPSSVFLLLIGHLSNPWWHPSLLKKCKQNASGQCKFMKKCGFNCNISAICNQNHEEHFHCRRDSSGLWITSSETPQCLSTGTWLEKCPKYPVNFEVEFNLLGHIGIVNKLSLPSLCKNTFYLCITNPFSLSCLFSRTICYSFLKGASGNLKTNSKK